MEIPIMDLCEDPLMKMNVDMDEKKEDIAYRLLCHTCLCVGRTLHKITDKKMSRFYMDILREIPLCDIPAICPTVCWECKASLRSATAFKEQVQDSYRILQTYTSETLNECLLSDIVRSSRLCVRENSPVNISPKKSVTETESESLKAELKIEWEINDDTIDDAEDADSELKREIIGDCPLLEDGSPSDCDARGDDASLAGKKRKKKSKIQSKIKRAERVVKRLRNGIKNSKKSKNVDDQKILTLELTYEEMHVEREKEAAKESYLNAPYKCESCLIGFNYKRSYKAHNSAKHNPELGNYICPICKTIISSVESFTAHYKRHMRRYECSICQKRTMDIKVMQQHYYSTHEISLKEYKCDLCGKISNSIDTHRYHKDTHKARVQCTDCDKTFTHRAGLLNHRLSVHELHNAFPCTVCEKVFRWKTSLKRHLEKHDVKDKCSSAYCGACGITFSSLSSLQRHMKNSLKHVTHDQLRFICDHCNRRFADKTKLRDHIEEKHLHRTFQCHICLKPSKNRVALDQHVRNVHKGRPNNKMCHHCGKAFPTKIQLESHIRTHTGERPFICELCPTTFSQQSNLYKHNRQVHLNIKSKRHPMCRKRKDEKIVEQPMEVVPQEYAPVAVLHYTPERGLIM